MKVVKLTDENCPVCQEMAEYDKRIVESFGANLVLSPFHDLGEDAKFLGDVYQYGMNEDGTVSMPLYIVYQDERVIGSSKGFQEEEEFVEFLESSVYFCK